MHEAIRAVHGCDITPPSYSAFADITTCTAQGGKSVRCNKVRVAKKVAESGADFSVLDLDDKVRQLVDFIRQANLVQ